MFLKRIYASAFLALCFLTIHAQNIAVNTAGTAAASTNMFEVTQTSTAANMVAIYAIHSGATAGTGYGLYATKTGASTTNIAGYFSATGATNNYAGIFDQGNVGVGITSPTYKLDVLTNLRISSAGQNSNIQMRGGSDGTSSSSIYLYNPSNQLSTLLSDGTYNSYVNAFGTTNMGIGTATPVVSLHVLSPIPIATAALPPYRTGMIVEGDQNTFGGRISVRQANSNASITLFRTNGTIAVPTTILSGDWLGNYAFGGYDGIVVNSFYGMSAYAAENWTATAHGSHIAFNTVNIGAGWSGTEKVRITSEGNVGIGTTSPSRLLHIRAAAPASPIYFGTRISTDDDASDPVVELYHETTNKGYRWRLGGGSTSTLFLDYSTNSFASTSSYMTVLNGGNVGIGNFTTGTTPGIVPNWTALSNMRVLEITGDGATASTFTDGVLLLSNNRPTATVGDQVGALCFAHKNNAGNFPAAIVSYLTGSGGVNGFGARLEFHTKPDNVSGHALRMIIDEAGNVGIATATPAYPLTVNGQPAANGYTAFTNYSDARLKKNISTIDNSLEKILKLRPVQFNYNEAYLNLYNDTASLSRVQKGFIAQEVKEIFPEMVGSVKVKGKEYYDLNLSNLQIYMVKAIQEQQKIIEEQNKKIENLNAQFGALQLALQALQLQVLGSQKK